MPKKNNASLAISLLALVAGMFMLAYASVPLYRLFCKATGFGGVATATYQAPSAVLPRIITVRFDANVSTQLGWKFYPQKKELSVHMGEKNTIEYVAQNNRNTTTLGTATFNISPVKAGIYFNKLQCFCFTRQTLAAHQSKHLGVTFFIDPAINDNPDLADVHTITLSYTFFPVKEK